MFSYFQKELEQKELFWQIKASIGTYTSGIYVIFKNDICLYVGQSKNLASRLATHLKGKYEECDKILVFISEEEKDFDLIPTEKYFIQKYKPIENLLVNFSEKIDTNKIMGSLGNDDTYNFLILNSKHSLFISDDEILPDLLSNKNIRYFLKTSINKVEEHIKNGR